MSQCELLRVTASYLSMGLSDIFVTIALLLPANHKRLSVIQKLVLHPDSGNVCIFSTHLQWLSVFYGSWIIRSRPRGSRIIIVWHEWEEMFVFLIHIFSGFLYFMDRGSLDQGHVDHGS